MKKLFLITTFIFLFALSASAQECPKDKVCLSIEAANKARENALELKATKEKVLILEDALKEKDKSIEEIKTTAAKNESDLREAILKTEIELATKTGQLIGAESMNVRLTAIVDLLLKSVKKKKFGLINIF